MMTDLSISAGDRIEVELMVQMQHKDRQILMLTEQVALHKSLAGVVHDNLRKMAVYRRQGITDKWLGRAVSFFVGVLFVQVAPFVVALVRRCL